MGKLVRQVRLRSGTAERTCLIDAHAVQAGSAVTLKDGEDESREWEVVWAANTVLSYEQVHRDWRVGGLT